VVSRKPTISGWGASLANLAPFFGPAALYESVVADSSSFVKSLSTLTSSHDDQISLGADRRGRCAAALGGSGSYTPPSAPSLPVGWRIPPSLVVRLQNAQGMSQRRHFPKETPARCRVSPPLCSFGPPLQGFGDELRAAVRANEVRLPSLVKQGHQGLNHLFGGFGPLNFYGETLSSVLFHYSQSLAAARPQCGPSRSRSSRRGPCAQPASLRTRSRWCPSGSAAFFAACRALSDPPPSTTDAPASHSLSSPLASAVPMLYGSRSGSSPEKGEFSRESSTIRSARRRSFCTLRSA
jgi:hypothetical protein